ncbi:hypothetical protein HYQ45_010585 [Verticillium longisporum]|uniref:Uncharacterized protein n=1 Tax=Verticillium longisporum TaxID=100787 RepID=A0A8I2ZG31_VERLO|nr:hypothetical protein HYQ45_010585 [Verticillium longisporum]
MPWLFLLHPPESVQLPCSLTHLVAPHRPLPSPFILEVQRRHRHPNRLLTHKYITSIRPPRDLGLTKLRRPRTGIPNQNGAPPRERRFGATNIASEDILLYNIFIFLITSTAADRYPTRHFHH